MLDGIGKVSGFGAGGVGGSLGLTQPQSVPSVGTVAGTPNAVHTEPLPTDFGVVLGQMTLEAISTLKGSEQTAIAGVRGKATSQQVVEAVLEAEQTLQASIAIRDKVVSAYLEVSRMTI